MVLKQSLFGDASRALKLHSLGCLVPLNSCQSTSSFLGSLGGVGHTKLPSHPASLPWRGWGRVRKSISSASALVASWVLCCPAGAEGRWRVLHYYSRWHIKGPPRPTFETPGDSESHVLAIEMTASLFLHTGGRLLLSVVGNLP